jgi:hypothetical protein
VRLLAAVTPGKHYRVEYKNNLDDPAWTLLEDNVPAVTATLTVYDTTTTSSQRFYRIVQLD